MQHASADGYDPNADGYSMKALTHIAGADAWWDQGYTGAGIGVALIDTGVAPVEGLNAPGKVIHGPDFSFESQDPNLAHLDTNGHGTVMAGIIAGKDSGLTAPYSAEPADEYRGIAPDAHIVSIKVGVADGGADVSQVIAAINWAINHRDDPGLNIRVLNLAYSVSSGQPASVDPLSYAVERAWRAGIVVVAATGNAGYVKKMSPEIANPAYNPYIIAVGAYDTLGTESTRDDEPGSYSQGSCAGPCRRPDFAAIGTGVQGLRVVNSFLDSKHPAAVRGDRYFRGSGTSQATAMTAGAAALVLQKYPTATPDAVKRLMSETTLKLRGPSRQRGAGALDLLAMAATPLPVAYVQKHTPSSGTGSIEQSRGNSRVTRDGIVIQGDVDIFGRPYTVELAAEEWSGSSWSGSSWSGSSWSGSSWSGTSWSGSSWSGSSWSGSSWSGTSWSGDNWSTGSWG